jgi:hypothetical protein
VRAIEEKTERSVALFGRNAAAISEIWSLFAEHGRAGWDGDDAAPLSPAAAMLAVRLIRVLPPDLPMPDFACEPDGSISLDWLLSRTRVFSLTAGMTDRLAYAWLDGTDRGYGVARFDDERIPNRILDALREIVLPHHAAIRIA